MRRDNLIGMSVLFAYCFNPRARMRRDDVIRVRILRSFGFNPRARMRRDIRNMLIGAS